MSKREHVGRKVEREIRIEAPADEVYAAWADPEMIARWFVDRMDGTMETGATVTWLWEKFGYRIPIEVYEAREGEYLRFGGDVPGRPPALQEIELRQEGGVTVLRLVNSGFGDGADWDEEYEGIDSGWIMALATLKYWLENKKSATRRQTMVMRPATFEYDQVIPLYESAAGLRSWLADDVTLSSDPLTDGATIRCANDGTTLLDGRLLARSPHELLLSWPEKSGVLCLKAFRAGPSRMLGLHYSGWDVTEDECAATEQTLDEVVGRLAERLPT